MQAFEVRLSRLFTGILMGVAGMFLIVGILAWIPGAIFATGAIPAIGLGMSLVASLFFILVPALILWRQWTYFAKPPVMLRVDQENVSFGTGLGYNLKSIPTKHLTKVSFGINAPSATDIRPEGWLIKSGVKLVFEKHPDVPSALVTSAGINFGFGTLRISRLYADKSVKEMIAGIEPFIVKR